ncbi:MAG: porin family protein, partial [Roseovarius sp.]|nr:porin family protein [Roseovarius sp.]
MRAVALSLLTAAAAGLGAPAFADLQPLALASSNLSFDAPSSALTATLSTQTSLAPGGSANWTGFYLGGQLGFGSVDSDLSGNDEDVIGGFTLGYDHDFGRWVLGGALDYDFADITAGPGTSVEEIFRVKLRAGPKIGNGLLYSAAGWANADT